MITINWYLIAITCAFIVMDVITGLINAIKSHEVSSTKMRDGLFHKCGLLCAIALSILCESAMTQIDLGLTIPIQPAICGYIIITELASILENICKIAPELATNKFMQIFKSKDANIE